MQTSLENMKKMSSSLAMTNIHVIEEEARVLDELSPEKENQSSQQNDFKGSIIVSQSSIQGFKDLNPEKRIENSKDD